MNSSDQTPKLPLWIFLVTDLALIGTAALFAATNPRPYSATMMVSIVVCVSLGAVVGLVPIVLMYERQKNAVLDERQQSLESLARTVNSSAEQLSIAASGLNGIAELALKNLRMAEHLPHKLQEKMAEFQAQLTTTVDTDKEELERELLALRTSESERLDTVSQRIAKSSAEWTKLEAATQQHLTAANEAVAKLALGTANAIGKAQAAAEQALAQARVEAARSLGETSGQAVRTIETAKTVALADLDARVVTAAAAIVARVTAELSTRSRVPIGVPSPDDAAAAVSPAVPVTTPPPPEPPRAEASPEARESSGSAGKRPRKPRREESPATDPTPARAPTAEAVPAAEPDAAPASVAVLPHPDATAPTPPAPVATVPVEEPPPVPATTFAEVEPIAPSTAEPFSGNIAPTQNGATAPVVETAPPASASKIARKRAARATEADEEPGLGLDLADAGGASMGEGVISSDGATRLLVTAYIGIGNRLFIRGSGPGLSWEKGVPLQFVSIGKWRWETDEAEGPVTFKLYKNDDLECAALGQQSLEPGRQQEVTAAF